MDFADRMTRSAILLLVLHLASSCIISPPSGSHDLPPPPSEEARARLGTLGVRVMTTEAVGLFDAPTAGKLRGMFKGFGLGAAAWAESGSNVQITGIVYILVLPVFVVIGGFTGLVRAPSESAVEVTLVNLNAALESHDLQQEFAPYFVRALRERTDVDFVVLAPGEERPPEIDVLLQVFIESVGLNGQGIDPAIPLRVRCRARLFGAPSESLRDTSIDFAWNTRSFTDWGEDEAVAVHDELAISLPFLAREVVDELFLVYLSPWSPLAEGEGR
jgi:hypothetical protein